jgi:membrane fusion protein, heavy metal efflux system
MTRKQGTAVTICLAIAVMAAAAAFWKSQRGGTVSPEAPAKERASDPAGSAAFVRLSEGQLKQFGVETAPAGPGKLRIEVMLPGEVTLNADRIAHVVPRVSGVVREVRKNLGDTVKRGEIMAVLESRELGDITALLLAARERVKLAQSNFDREEQLWKKKISPEQDYIQARNALAETGIELRSAEQKLRALGFSDDYISRLSDRPGPMSLLYEMAAPYDATVIEKHVALGEVLKEESQAFVIADLSTVWANLDVHQKDLPLIQVGQTVAIGVGSSAPTIQETISFLEPIAEETNRTIHARVVLPNRGGRWRPGLFVTGRVTVENAEAAVLIPNEALLMIGGKTCVFVRDGDRFRVQQVVPGRTDGTVTEINGGLTPGQVFVCKGAFTLKSELGKPEEEK